MISACFNFLVSDPNPVFFRNKKRKVEATLSRLMATMSDSRDCTPRAGTIISLIPPTPFGPKTKPVRLSTRNNIAWACKRIDAGTSLSAGRGNGRTQIHALERRHLYGVRIKKYREGMDLLLKKKELIFVFQILI